MKFVENKEKKTVSRIVLMFSFSKRKSINRIRISFTKKWQFRWKRFQL